MVKVLSGLSEDERAQAAMPLRKLGISAEKML